MCIRSLYVRVSWTTVAAQYFCWATYMLNMTSDSLFWKTMGPQLESGKLPQHSITDRSCAPVRDCGCILVRDSKYTISEKVSCCFLPLNDWWSEPSSSTLRIAMLRITGNICFWNTAFLHCLACGKLGQTFGHRLHLKNTLIFRFFFTKTALFCYIRIV